MTGSLCPICQSPLAPGQDPCPACGAALGLGASAPARNLAVGSTLHQGKFTVGRVLGEGGFGITYKGAHRELRRPMAIKELFPLDLGATRLGTRVSVPAPQADAFRYAREQALQEARIIAGFRSRNIVDVYDMFLENDTAYIVMEYLEGETLEARLERAGNLPPDEVQELAKALCEALAEVHDGNWLHRDIKPSNIVLAADQRVVLIDFGSAREFHLHRTQRHTRILTAQYAAPEQYSEAARFGPYTDAFSLGATLYHALTGAPPPSAMDRFQSGRDLDFPPGVPSRLATALQQALALRVEDRPSSISTFLALVQGSDEGTAATASTRPAVGMPVWIGSSASSSESDREALEAFYNAVGDIHFHDDLDMIGKNLDGSPSADSKWFSDAPLADWEGVTVDDAGRVIKLNVIVDYWERAIPVELVQLTNLRVLSLPSYFGTDLNSHDYKSPWGIPAELGQLTNLHTLNLTGHALSGAIPVELSQLTNLHTLNLSDNRLSGYIPVELSRLTNLYTLNLSSNRLLSGSIPAELGQLTQLQELDLSLNQLSGPIPVELGRLTNLNTLNLNNNLRSREAISGLSGPIPAELGRLINLHTLNLKINKLSGTIPAELGQLIQLQKLDLSLNQLSGPIPVELSRLANLQICNFDANEHLEEDMPTELIEHLKRNWDR